MEKLILIGAGGYSKSVLDSVDIYNYTMCGFLDEFSKEKSHLGYPIHGNSLNDLKNCEDYVFFVSIGNNLARKKWFDLLKEKNLRFVNIIDKTAIISPNAKIGNGCFVGKMAIINACALIGDNCLINTKALVEHGCKIGNNVNISTNSVINGDVKIGDGSFVGSSSVIIGQKSVGKWSTVGAGAVVINNIGDNVTAVGVPAKVIKEGAMLG